MTQSSGERRRNPWEEDPFEKEYPYEYLKYEVDRKENIATVTLSNPTNDTAPIWYCYPGLKLIARWERDDDVKVVIIKSAGKNFCTGHDIGDQLESVDHAMAAGKNLHMTNRQLVLGAMDMFRFHTRLLCSLKPTIAQVHGYCTNAGMGLQTECDMTIASEDAQFGEEFSEITGIRGMIGTVRGINPIGRKLYREMISCKKLINARQAAEMGIINRVVPRAKLDEEVWKEAKRIAATPLDELVVGKDSTREERFRSGTIAPPLTVPLHATLKHERNEFWFFNTVRQKGAREAIRERQALWELLGGFGAPAEVDRW